MDQKFQLVRQPATAGRVGGEHKLSLTPGSNVTTGGTSGPRALGVAQRRTTLTISRNAPGRKRGGKREPNLPKQIDAVVTVGFIRRFQLNNNAASVAVTRRSMGFAIAACVCSVANTTMVSTITSYRIKKVVHWPAAASVTLFDWSTAGSTAEQALNKDSAMVNSLPTGITVDKVQVWRPKPKSYLSFFQMMSSNGTDQLCAISGASGGIIDIHGAFTLNMGAIPGLTTTITTTSTIAVGVVAHGSLDTSGKITPLGTALFSY